MADEYIKREDAINAALEQLPVCFEMYAVESALTELPAADVRPVVYAQWLGIVQAVVNSIGVCSNCCAEAVWRTRKKPYVVCPNCGADMREVDDDCRRT